MPGDGWLITIELEYGVDEALTEARQAEEENRRSQVLYPA